MSDSHACPTCGLTGGFHDNEDGDMDSPHAHARDRIPPELTRPANTVIRRQQRNERQRAYAEWSKEQAS